MNSPALPSHNPRPWNGIVKLILIGVVIGALLIPLIMVGVLVAERSGRRDAVTREVASMWGGRQTVGLVVLTVPYDETRQTAGGVDVVTRYAHFLPRTLEVTVDVVPEVRSRSIFRVVVYRATVSLRGEFSLPDMAAAGATPSAVHWDRARLALGVSDVRGLTAVSPLSFDERSIPFEPGASLTLVESPGGVHALVSVVRAERPDARRDSIPFSASFTVAGTEQIAFLPSGALTTVTLTTPWADASFGGAFLPVTRTRENAQTTAQWQVTHYARGYPQAWVEGATPTDDLRRQLDRAAFHLALVQPVDHYQQVERAVKYGVLFIALTFLVFFLWDILRMLQLHPVQYGMVGAALVVFYLMLLSLSEHVRFPIAYLAAATATVGLVSGYAGAILRSGARGAGLVGAWLAILYGVLYVLLTLEDLALLVGSLLVFVALATLMWTTRRIDWSQER